MSPKLRFRTITAILLLSIILFPALSGAWGFCDRSFVFLGKTAGDSCTLAFMEIGFGSCESWNIRYLSLGPDGLISDQRSGGDPPFLPVWDTSMVIGNKLEWIQRFWLIDDEYILKYSRDLRLQKPEFDSTFAQLWRDSLGNLYGELREEVYKSNFDEPRFNKPVGLIWFLPGSLYKNYEIAEAIITGSYIFIRTYQPLEVQYNSQHGLLLYRLK